ncbi:HXXEE domain-containing protein [Paenibacillus sp. SN-8-1]|uniref:HXXEE domain-containing protein n=1 Tax=Paenibacillus sp. SN-8-1 TaxID=3435409 RepID=UPI003D9A3DBA
MNSLIWMFLAVFIIHDFEEIITVEPWMKKNYSQISALIPKPLENVLKKFSTIKSSQFAIAVLIEFVVFVPTTYMAAEYREYGLFLGFNVILFIHVFTHLLQSIFLRRYTPGVVTAIFLILPYTVYLFYRFVDDGLVSLSGIWESGLAGLIILPIVFLGHLIAGKIIRV